VPLSHLYKMVRTKKGRVNRARAAIGQLLEEGDVASIRGPEVALVCPQRRMRRKAQERMPWRYNSWSASEVLMNASQMLRSGRGARPNRSVGVVSLLSIHVLQLLTRGALHQSKRDE
jgi:hypothetical protein